MTRIGVLGCGAWGRLIVRDLCTLGCRVTIVDPAPAARAQALTLGAAHAIADLDGLESQDGYVVASPSLLHVAHVRALLPRARPIFCEKPLATSSTELRLLGDDGARLVFSMDKWRYHPGVVWLADCARERRLGSVQGLSLIRVSGPSPANSLNIMWHLVPHDLSIVLEILGFLPEVVASCASRIGEWAYGCRIVLGTTPWVDIETSERRAKSYREVRLVCSEGEATLAGAYAGEIAVRRHTVERTGDAERIPIAAEMPLLAELRVFVDFVRNTGPAPKSSLLDAAAIVRHIETIHAMAGVAVNAQRVA